MSERVKAKRERDRKRAEEAAKARGEELPREPSPDDDTRSKGARAASASASAAGKKRKYSGVDDDRRNEEYLRDGRHVSEPFTATPSSSSVSLRSPSITLPTPISIASGLPHSQQKQSTRLPSFSSTVADIGASASTSGTSYTSHIPPPLDSLSAAYGISGTRTPVSPLLNSPLDTTSTGLISAALEGGFLTELQQPFSHGNSQHTPFGNFGTGTSSPAQDPTAALLTRLLSSLPGGAGANNGQNFNNHNNDNFSQNSNNNGLPPLPELLSIIMKNPELQRRILQHQMAQKAQQNQMANQQPQSFPSSSTSFPSSSLFGFESFDSRANVSQDSLPNLGTSGDNGINMARMDPSTLFNDLFNNGKNLQSNSSHAPGHEANNSNFLSGIMDTIDPQDSQFPSVASNGNDRPSSAGAQGNIPNYDRLFSNQGQGFDQSSGSDRPYLSGTSNAVRKDPPTQMPLPFKNIFQSPHGSNHIARPSSVPLPHNRSQSERPTHTSRMSSSGKTAEQSGQSASADLKGKGKQAEIPHQNSGTVNTPASVSGRPASSGSKPQPDLLHRLRHCCHLSDMHVTSDPGLLLFASRLCLAVGCEHNGKHADSNPTSAGADNGSFEPGSDRDFLKLEAAWQLLRQHLDPPSPSIDGFPSLPDENSSAEGSKATGKPVDGQNQIATGRLAAEMVLRAVRAKTQAHDGEDTQVSGKGMSRWIACRRTLGMSLDSAMIMALVNGFGGNWDSMQA